MDEIKRRLRVRNLWSWSLVSLLASCGPSAPPEKRMGCPHFDMSSLLREHAPVTVVNVAESSVTFRDRDGSYVELLMGGHGLSRQDLGRVIQ